MGPSGKNLQRPEAYAKILAQHEVMYRALGDIKKIPESIPAEVAIAKARQIVDVVLEIIGE
jgi:hypothetical protein